jgi:hypothetical protein
MLLDGPEVVLGALCAGDQRLRRPSVGSAASLPAPVALAESLLHRHGFDPDHMARHLATRWRAEPWRGYGSGPPQVFTAMATGVPWPQAAGALFDGQGSHGNGAAMRVAPAALLTAPDLWVPDIRSPQAACTYSWISPPSRSRRTTLPAGATTAGSPGPSGGSCPKARCGRCAL